MSSANISSSGDSTLVAADLVWPDLRVRAGMHDSGRRVYIHEHSFNILCQRSAAAATIILPAILTTAASKMAHRHIADDGRLAGVLGAATIERVESSLARCFAAPIAEALRVLGFRGSDPRVRRQIFPVLHPSEHVAGSCHEAGYYTFATTPAAAERMYDDKMSPREIRAAIQDGLEEVSDLTVITGRSLVLLSDREDSDTTHATSYAKYLAPKSTSLTHDHMQFVTETIDKLVQELEANLKPLAASGTSEAQFVSGKIDLIRELLPNSVLNVV
jgi:hypothetical protein